MQNIAKDVLVAKAPGLDEDAAWQVARQKETARIAGRAYDPKSPSAMGPALAVHPYAAEQRIMERYAANQDPVEFASDRVGSLRGLVTGANGEAHDGFTEDRHGLKPEAEDVDALLPHQMPFAVPGRTWSRSTSARTWRTRSCRTGSNTSWTRW